MLLHLVMRKKIGFLIVFVMYEQVLTEEQQPCFEKLFEEGYDMRDNSLDGRMWLHYKQTRMVMSNILRK